MAEDRELTMAERWALDEQAPGRIVPGDAKPRWQRDGLAGYEPGAPAQPRLEDVEGASNAEDGTD